MKARRAPCSARQRRGRAPALAPRSITKAAIALKTVIALGLVAALQVSLAPADRVMAAEEPQAFLRGDANVDGNVTLSDAFAILRFLSEDFALKCQDGADVDDDGVVTQIDVFYLLSTLFYRHAPPPPPFPKPGVDPTDDDLSCSRGILAAPDSPEPSAPKGAGGDEAKSDPLDDPGGVPCEDDGGGAEIDFLHFRGSVLATPGETAICVPVYLTTAGEVEGITLSFYAPPKYLRLEEVDFSRSYLYTLGLRPDWTHTFLGLQGQGYLAGTVALSLGTTVKTIPPTQGGVLAYLQFSVLPEVPIGTYTEILFRTTPGEKGFLPIPNEVSRRGNPQVRRICGLAVEIVDGSDVFIRGDANRDRSVNISDVVAVLQWLFTPGGGGLDLIPCPDAADVNDSGDIGITDAVVLASYLFLRGAAPVLPFPSAGRDWSEDVLGCVD